MTILTIDEAAQFLRVTTRTLYRRLEIPRIRIGHQLRFVREDLEGWIASQRPAAPSLSTEPLNAELRVDERRSEPYHRNPVFRMPAGGSV